MQLLIYSKPAMSWLSDLQEIERRIFPMQAEGKYTANVKFTNVTVSKKQNVADINLMIFEVKI